MAFMDSARYRWSASSMLRNFVQYYSDASTSFGGSAGGTNAAYPMSKALNARFEALNSNPSLSASSCFFLAIISASVRICPFPCPRLVRLLANLCGGEPPYRQKPEGLVQYLGSVDKG